MTDRFVNTYKVVRRQNLGDGHWRENGELIPEAHTWGIKDSYVHSGEIEEANHVPEAEFRAAVKKYCPKQADQIFELAGLGSGNLEGDRGSPRVQNMTPALVHENMRPGHIHNPGPHRGRADMPVAIGEQDHVTVVGTEIGQNIPTPDYPEMMEIDMGEYLHDGSDGGGEVQGAVHGPAATNVYEDATTLDPKTENELVGNSSPEALKAAKESAKDVLNRDGTVKDDFVEKLANKDVTAIQSDVSIDQTGSPAKPAAKKAAARKAARKSPDAKADGTPKPGVAEKEGSNRQPARKAAAKKSPAKKSLRTEISKG